MVQIKEAGNISHLFIKAANGQELAAGTPGDRFDTQGPLVGAEGGEQPPVEGVQQDLVLKHRQSHSKNQQRC